MAQTDPEDALDQTMVSSWNAVAQQIRTLYMRLRNDHERFQSRRARDEETERAERVRMSHRQAQLAQWERDNRVRLNNGFESALQATVLSPSDAWRGMGDAALLQTWIVADQLEGNDPGFNRQIIEAKRRLKDEWSRRHPDQPVDRAADGLSNRITVTYADTSPELQTTLDAFGKAGVPYTTRRVEPDEYARLHGADSSFWVDSTLNGSWGGYDHDRIVETVMTSPVLDLDAVDTRISFLKDQGLPESSHADTAAGGHEPSSTSETERSETGDNAPFHTTSETMEDRADGIPARRAAPDSAEPAGRGDDADADAVRGDEPAADHAAAYEDMPIGLDEPEDWHGPDMFGEYSPADEAAMGAAASEGRAGSMPVAFPQETHVAVHAPASR